jgi:hypothetical protein
MMKKMAVLLSLTSFSIYCLFLFKTCTFQSSKTSFTSPVSLPEKKELPFSSKPEETSLKSVPDDELKTSKNKCNVILKDSLLDEITSPPLKYYSGKN